MEKIAHKDREDKWQHLVFYNFVQRPMKTNQKRPTKQPTEGIFIGFAAADSANNPYKCEERNKDYVGRYAARLFNVPLDDQHTCPRMLSTKS